MKEFDEIYLSWRSGQGKGRYLVGVLKRNVNNEFTFAYDKIAVDSAKKEGFTDYAGLPYLEGLYTGKVLDFFAQRLTKSVRSDVHTFYDFWEIDPKQVSDNFYMLGHTQGLLPTDNFEFLADYKPVEGLHFLTDLAHITSRNHTPNSILSGDVLTYKLDTNNAHDKYAVRVYKGALEIGFIKQVHSKVFHKVGGEHLQLKVKAIDQNGVIKRIFVTVVKP